MRYFVHLAYNGTNFRGWQRQKETSITIQESIEFHLSKMLKQPIKVAGCGRTDAGVHASQYFLHFDYDLDFNFDPVIRINLMLPEDIRVFEFIPVHDKAHTQYDATQRTYTFHLHWNHNPFIAQTSLYIKNDNLDFSAMQEAVTYISRQTDFKSMCKKPNQYKTTLCHLSEFVLIENETNMVFRISANRFLQSMVRLIVARVLDVGQGRLTLAQLKSQFLSGRPPQFPTTAYPQGLYLAKVKYPYLDRANGLEHSK